MRQTPFRANFNPILSLLLRSFGFCGSLPMILIISFHKPILSYGTRPPFPTMKFSCGFPSEVPLSTDHVHSSDLCWSFFFFLSACCCIASCFKVFLNDANFLSWSFLLDWNSSSLFSFVPQTLPGYSRNTCGQSSQVNFFLQRASTLHVMLETLYRGWFLFFSPLQLFVPPILVGSDSFSRFPNPGLLFMLLPLSSIPVQLMVFFIPFPTLTEPASFRRLAPIMIRAQLRSETSATFV